MRIDLELAQPSVDYDSVLTVGVFDGVHRGHRRLIGQLRREATAQGRLAGVVTFREHPRAVLRPDFTPRYLTTLEERLRLIHDLGVDLIVSITFDRDLSLLSVRDFAGLLQRHLRMRGLVVGPDFAMGHNREGDVARLTALGKEMGFSVTVVDPFRDRGIVVGSTTTRKALAEGDVARVAKQLGRHYALKGRVAKGVGRGKSMGFPTANLEAPAEMAVPGDGIYATWARIGDRCYMAATSIGVRPTFDEGFRTIEAFILDFDGDLYEHEIDLEFVRRLRDEEKYETVQGLQEQVDRDVRQTRSILESSRANPV